MSGASERSDPGTVLPVFLARVIESVTQKSASPNNPIALEHLEPWTGRLLATDVSEEGRFDSSGIAFHAGDVLFGKLRPYLAKVWVASGPGTAVGDFLVLRSETVVPEFLQYLLLDEGLITFLSAMSYGSKMPRTSWEQLKSIKRIIPDRVTQMDVVRYLDRETAQIDELIAKQEQLVRLVREREQSLVDLAFHGIPQTNRVQHVVESLTPGASVESYEAEVGPNDPGILRSSSLATGVFRPDKVKAVAASDLHRLKSPVEKGTVIVSRMNTPKLVGAAAYMDRDLPNLFVPDKLWVVRAKCEPRYFWLWTQTTEYKGRVAAQATGASGSMQNLSRNEFLKFPFPATPIAEQRSVVEAVALELRALAILSSKATEMIALLKERRQALISAAVTGKIDVTGKA